MSRLDGTLDSGITLIRSASRQVASANTGSANRSNTGCRRGRYARALLIIIVPMLVLQGVIAFVFMERHWNTVTQRLSEAVVRDIASLIDIYKLYPQDKGPRDPDRHRAEPARAAGDFLPGTDLPPPDRSRSFSLLDQALSRQIGQQVRRPFWIDTVGRSSQVEIRIKLDDQVMRVFARRTPPTPRTRKSFLFWMVGTARAARGRDPVPAQSDQADPAAGGGRRELRQGPRVPNFRPRAREVRQAAQSFMEMKSRVERTIEQRTAMLAGVSHDLRTS